MKIQSIDVEREGFKRPEYIWQQLHFSFEKYALKDNMYMGYILQTGLHTMS
jgi:hypothetical protein